MTAPHLLFMNGSIIDLRGKNRWILGRQSAHVEVDIDLGPFGAIEHGVSRQHAAIECDGESFVVADLASTNETTLNNFRLAPHQRYALHDGDVLMLGNLQCRFMLTQTQLSRTNL